MTETLVDNKAKAGSGFGCGDARPRFARVFPVAQLISSVAPPSGGAISDGEYVQTARFVEELPDRMAFRIAQTFAFRGNSVHFRWAEFYDETDSGGPLHEGKGTYVTQGNLLKIEYVLCDTGESGSFTFEYSASTSGLELISARHTDALSGRFALQ
jgi:hypothetical protein